jgi:uncharacterized protein
MGVLDLIEGVVRGDGWANVLAGLGLASRDRGANTEFLAGMRLDPQTLAELYRYDDICRTVVSLYPQEALKRGILVKGEPSPDDDEPPGPVTLELDRLRVRYQIQRAATWGRLFGGALIVLGVRDGRLPTEPLGPGPHRIDFLDVYDRRQIQREQTWDDPREWSFGDCKIFRVTQVRGGQFLVHRSRCLVFGGAETADREREENAGWDDSVLQVVYEVVKLFSAGYLSVGNMLTDASQAVFKIRGLIAAVAGNQREALSRRLQLVDLSRSVARAVMLDADGGEEFTKVPTQFADVPQTLDRLAARLAAATGIPVTRLLGQAPAGLNATGESDTRNWYDSVQVYRKHEIEPQVQRVFSLLAPGSRPQWPALWVPTDLEVATLGKTEAETDALYISNDVFLPEEIKAKRKGYAPAPAPAPAPVPVKPNGAPPPTPSQDPPQGPGPSP